MKIPYKSRVEKQRVPKWPQNFESAPLWPLRYLSIIVMHKCASQLWSLMKWGSMSLLIESTSHSQLGGRGACSPDVELANPRHRRDISPWCILYIFDSAVFEPQHWYYIIQTQKKQEIFKYFLSFATIFSERHNKFNKYSKNIEIQPLPRLERASYILFPQTHKTKITA